MSTVTEPRSGAKTARERIDSIDILRGVVMAIMILDHVRDYFHRDAQLFSPEDLAHTNGWLFLTRWMTHFCAPVFIFLAGVSVHFSSQRRTSLPLMTRFLISRGVWIIALDWTLVNIGESFNFAYSFVLLQVLWATGWCMIALASLIWLPRSVVAGIALGMIALHNAFDWVKPEAWGRFGWAWSILHVPTFMHAGGHTLIFLYPLIPWIGVMAAGYCFGPVMQMEARRRRQALARLGAGLTALFFLLRLSNVYGDPRTWGVQASGTLTAISFFNVNKYPPSLLYLLMTLGPALLLLAIIDQVRIKEHNVFRVFGRVPMFYYLIHWYVLHALAIVLGGLRYGRWDFYFTMPLPVLGLPAPGFPQDYGYNLAIVYLIWLGLVSSLYLPCRWYMDFKNRSHAWWLSYL